MSCVVAIEKVIVRRLGSYKEEAAHGRRLAGIEHLFYGVQLLVSIRAVQLGTIRLVRSGSSYLGTQSRL